MESNRKPNSVHDVRNPEAWSEDDNGMAEILRQRREELLAAQAQVKTPDDVSDLAQTLEHLAECVDEGRWFEINEISANLLLSYIQELEQKEMP